MLKKSLSAAVLSTTLAFAVQAQAEVSATVGFTNDYRFHGISQTAGDAAIQGSLDMAFDNGVYIGAWGSNVDFGPGEDVNLEIDYYVGYASEINDDLSYDVFLAYYTYPGYEGVDADYLELNTGLYYGDFALTYTYAGDYFNTGMDGQYVALDYSYGITDEVSLDLHAGHSFGDYWNGSDDINEYEDYSVGVSGSAAGLDLSAAYIITSIDDGDETDTGAFRNDDTLLISVSRSF